MQHFCRSDSVDDPDAAGIMDRVPRRLRQRLACGHTRPQRADPRPLQVGNHGAIGSGGSREHRDPMAFDGLEHAGWGRLLDQERRCSHSKGEHDTLAEPERERQGRARGEQIVWSRSQHMA